MLVDYGLLGSAIRPQLSGQPWSQARRYSDAALRSVIGPLLPRKRIGRSSSGGGPVAARPPPSERRRWRTRAESRARSPPASTRTRRPIHLRLSACSMPSSLHDQPEPARQYVRVQLREILAGVGAILLAGLLPERNPLAAMAIAHALRGAHDREHNRPDRHVREIAAAGPRATAQSAAGSNRRSGPDRTARSIAWIDRFSSGTCSSLS